MFHVITLPTEKRSKQSWSEKKLSFWETFSKSRGNYAILVQLLCRLKRGIMAGYEAFGKCVSCSKDEVYLISYYTSLISNEHHCNVLDQNSKTFFTPFMYSWVRNKRTLHVYWFWWFFPPILLLFRTIHMFIEIARKLLSQKKPLELCLILMRYHNFLIKFLKKFSHSYSYYGPCAYWLVKIFPPLCLFQIVCFIWTL